MCNCMLTGNSRSNLVTRLNFNVELVDGKKNMRQSNRVVTVLVRWVQVVIKLLGD